ncbi:hypothetical protein B0H14DRAFT_2625485 [Mycena olivaceomarginata]|nr:hypothetical protein B0H14DRAFT_2625485 [Mycena olivaceomarginata]
MSVTGQEIWHREHRPSKPDILRREDHTVVWLHCFPVPSWIQRANARGREFDLRRASNSRVIHTTASPVPSGIQTPEGRMPEASPRFKPRMGKCLQMHERMPHVAGFKARKGECQRLPRDSKPGWGEFELRRANKDRSIGFSDHSTGYKMGKNAEKEIEQGKIPQRIRKHPESHKYSSESYQYKRDLERRARFSLAAIIENKRARIEEILDEDNLPKRSTTRVPLAAREDTSTTEETGNPPIPRYTPPQLDPDLIEIIGRFEMMDEDPSDGLAPEPPEDMSSDDEDEADETEIQDLSVLEKFSATLLRAQQIAVAKERELEKSRKRPRTYTKNSKRTNERNRFRDLQAKGFASVANFFSHVRDTISKRPRTEETTVDSHTECPREEAESSRMTAREAGMRSDEGTRVDEGEEEESADESENGDSLPAEGEMPGPENDSARETVEQMLRDLRAGQRLKDDTLSTSLPRPSSCPLISANAPTPQDTPQAHIASIRDIIGTARANKKNPTVNGYAQINASLDVLESILKAGDYVATALTSFRADLIADLVAATSRSSTTSYSSVARSNPAPPPPAPSAPKAAPAAKNNEFVISLDKATDELLARPLPEIKAKVEAAAAATGVDKLKGVKLKGVKVLPRDRLLVAANWEKTATLLKQSAPHWTPTTGEKQPLSRPSLRACGQRSTPHLRPNLPQRRPRVLCQQPLRHLQPFHHHCALRDPKKKASSILFTLSDPLSANFSISQGLAIESTICYPIDTKNPPRNAITAKAMDIHSTSARKRPPTCARCSRPCSG